MEIAQEVWTLTQPKRDNVSSDPLPVDSQDFCSLPVLMRRIKGKLKILREKGELTVDCREMPSKNMAREIFAHR